MKKKSFIALPDHVEVWPFLRAESKKNGLAKSGGA